MVLMHNLFQGGPHYYQPINDTERVENDRPLDLHPGHHKATDLASKLLKHIDLSRPDFRYNTRSPEAIKSLEEMASSHATNGSHHFDLQRFTELEYIEFLNKLCQNFNTIFFMDLLPPTKVSRKECPSTTVSADRSVIIPPAELVIHSVTAILRSESKAEIFLHGSEKSWKHIGALLGAMIELYLKYFGCRCDDCRKDIHGYGITGKGEAWQQIAGNLETSPLFEKIRDKFFVGDADFGFCRRELYVMELSYWNFPEEVVAEPNVLASWGWTNARNNVGVSLVASAREMMKKREDSTKR
ncbi:hypothetical protein NHQ30_010910 [Ciborinia camelliae]|nr:hypothetical protein NHQ30_010910 [Ciborinia camelliae]